MTVIDQELARVHKIQYWLQGCNLLLENGCGHVGLNNKHMEQQSQRKFKFVHVFTSATSERLSHLNRVSINARRKH